MMIRCTNDYTLYLTSICSFLITIPLGIVAIILSQRTAECELITLNINDYLLGIGISTILNGLILLTRSLFNLFGNPLLTSDLFLMMYITNVFTFVWFILAPIMLFNSNIQCIISSIPIGNYILCLWCIIVFTILFSCKNMKTEQDGEDEYKRMLLKATEL